MPSIYTLTTDIQYLLTQRGWVTDELSDQLGHGVSQRFKARFTERENRPTLRLSKMGPQCPCALWHSIHSPELEEPLPPWAQEKFFFGDIVEAQAITLAKAAGHIVEGEQDEVSVDGILGHRDCVIDGAIVDVKSCNSLSFADFKSRNVEKLHAWGYLSQLDAYLVGSLDDPKVTIKDRAYLLAIDKAMGHMYLYEHFLREQLIRDTVRRYKEIVERPSAPPCECGTLPEGSSGNIKLATKASYNSFKYACFPGIRKFIYSKGPVYFTKVVKKPTYMGLDLVEVDRFGKTVYN